MRTTRVLRSAPAVLPLLAALGLFAQQSNREPYRAAYRTWREAEPDLESDAATFSPTLTGRANHALAAAASFGSVRAAFLRQLADDQGQNVLWMQNNTPAKLADFIFTKDLQRLVSAETATVNATIATFARDTDRGIQQLRQALEQERTALAALNGAITEREKVLDKAAQVEEALDPVRTKALTGYQDMTGLLSDSAALVDQESGAWAKYYPALNAESRAPGAPPAGPVSSLSPGPAPATSGAPATARTGGVPPLPLTRYTGLWVYPTVNGRFFGAEPEFVDFSVHEENGHVTGAFYARFKLPQGSSGDPVLRFDFSGDLSDKRVQSFALETTDGAKGTIELIPGNAFNLLEVNFQTDPSPGKIRAADLVLVKK